MRRRLSRIEGGMPRIIDGRSLGEGASENGERMKRGPSGEQGERDVSYYLGIIFCGKCGGAMVGNRRYAGRNKTLQVTYECSIRKRTKSCDMKNIRKDYVENIVIEYLEKNVFSPEAIDTIAKKVMEYAAEQTKEIDRDIKAFTDRLTGIKTEINNIVNAIAAGMFHPSMKEKMDELEAKRSALELKIEEAKIQAQAHAPSEEMIRAYLAKDADIRSRTPEEQKQIIQTYVKKVIVYDDTLDIHSIDMSRHNIYEGGCGYGEVRLASTNKTLVLQGFYYLKSDLVDNKFGIHKNFQ
ncbi:MAG: recombinase zinc beta ribbon domain-containing protein [Clostridia bacterium]